MRSGESGGVGCSSGFIDRGTSGSLRPCLSGIVTCRGDSCCFPVLGEGCDSFQVGPCHGLPRLPNFLFPISLILVLFPSVTPGRFAHRSLTYRWIVLAFSRDFHTFPSASLSFYGLP